MYSRRIQYARGQRITPVYSGTNKMLYTKFFCIRESFRVESMFKISFMYAYAVMYAHKYVIRAIFGLGS